jgi:endogenous inhibitor of DNA gyrase (YacG/DUF329 family)
LGIPLAFASYGKFIWGMKRQIKCPTCKKIGDWFARSYGPFCSRRCKLIDLGKWFGEENVISQPLRPEHLEESLPDGEESLNQ